MTPSVYDWVVIIGLAATIVILLMVPSGGRSPFSRGARSFLIGAAALYLFVPLGEVFASHAQSSAFETLERSLEMLFVPTLVFAEYSLLARQKVIDARVAHADLERQTAWMVKLVENSPAGTVVLDAEGAIAFANQAAREILDLDARDFADSGAPPWVAKMDLNHTGILVPVRDWSALVVPEALADINVVVEWPNGLRRRLTLTSAPTYSAEGRLDGAIVSFVDKEPWRATSR